MAGGLHTAGCLRAAIEAGTDGSLARLRVSVVRFLDVAVVCYRNSVVVVSLDAKSFNAWGRFRGGIGTLILILLQLGSCYVDCCSLKSSQYPCRVLRYR